MLQIIRLIWDEWNITHIARHGITPEEVEDVCGGDPVTSETYDQRLRVIGESRTGRVLTAILAPKEEGVYYPVTARPASRRERTIYQHARGGEAA